eukprot:Gb_38378 [translate_table: standard]
MVSPSIALDAKTISCIGGVVRLSSILLRYGEAIIAWKGGRRGVNFYFIDISAKSSTVSPSKGAFTRVSGTPITKAQLLLGPISASSHIDSRDVDSKDEGDSESLAKDNLARIPKDKGYKKRKPPTQVLSASLAKCSRRSSRLQRKSMGNSTPMDVAENTKEERKFDDPSRLDGKSSPQKGFAATSSGSDKGLVTLFCCLRI